MRYVYLAQGKLYYCQGSNTAKLIESPFALDIVNRAVQRQQSKSWKTGGSSAAAMMARQSMMMDGEGRAVKVRITAVAPGDKPSELLYVVTSDAVGGLFSYDLETQVEKRIFHKENLFLSDFHRNPSRDVIACAQRNVDMTSSISVRQGNDVSPVTEGDSSDEAPSWVENNDKQLVYQTAGVARNQGGVAVGLGPAAVQKLDLGSGTVTTLVEDEEHDYLCPRATAGGDLFYIKRPFEPIFKKRYPLKKFLLDAVLFPFRLMRAIFDFLNIFSMLVSRKPLTTAGGPKMEGADEKALFLRGRLIEAEEDLKKQSTDSDQMYLVPRTWKLTQRSADGKETAVCEGVLAYDLTHDGKIVYSTGAAVYSCNRDGSARTLLSKQKFVDTILILAEAT